VPLSTYPEAKQRHTHEDLRRWARYYDEPFSFPHRFPMSTVTAQRLLICAKSRDRISALTLALFRAYWADDQDLADPAVLEAALRSVGLPASLLEEAVSAPIKEQLHKYTDEAQALGVFGVPTFVVEKQAGPPALIFGQDRLLFVEKALMGSLDAAT
jgi:2-hydroxychromene-2-carboxylate isomerase